MVLLLHSYISLLLLSDFLEFLEVKMIYRTYRYSETCCYLSPIVRISLVIGETLFPY